MILKMINGKNHLCKANDLVECKEHDVQVLFSQLGPIGLMALEEGLDTRDECLFLSDLTGDSHAGRVKKNHNV